nr:CHRD domain-containing protein [uncultured Friedmanniella sp.]
MPAAYAHEGRGSDSRNDRKLSATLKGEREVPGPGDPDGRGTARIKVQQDQVCFHLSWRSIEAPTAAHIHVGPRDVAGPVVVGLFSAPRWIRT